MPWKPWKNKDKLMCNGGSGLGLHRTKPPTDRQQALRDLEEKLKKFSLPHHYARKIQRLKLRPRALGNLLKCIVELRAELRVTEGQLVNIRSQIKAVLKGGEITDVR